MVKNTYWETVYYYSNSSIYRASRGKRKMHGISRGTSSTKMVKWEVAVIFLGLQMASPYFWYLERRTQCSGTVKWRPLQCFWYNCGRPDVCYGDYTEGWRKFVAPTGRTPDGREHVVQLPSAGGGYKTNTFLLLTLLYSFYL